MGNQMRPISVIAQEIQSSWTNPYFGAAPYLNAMLSLDTVDDNYGADDAKTIILYFLSNASTWRGADARRVKAELKEIIR